MKILKFNYTKKTDDVSERIFIPITEPHVLYNGLDITNLEKDKQTEVIHVLANLRNACDKIFKEKILELGLEKQFRSFIPTRMSEIDISYKGDTCPELIAEKVLNQEACCPNM